MKLRHEAPTGLIWTHAMRRCDTRTRKRVIVDVRSSRNLDTNRVVAPYCPFAAPRNPRKLFKPRAATGYSLSAVRPDTCHCSASTPPLRLSLTLPKRHLMLLLNPHFRSDVQSIVIRLGTGPWLRFGISVMCAFSSLLSTFRAAIWGFRPLPKLAVHKIAFVMVITIRTIVMTANAVRGFLTGINCFSCEG